MPRVALSRMSQDRGEPVRAFVARLHGQVEVCRFTKKCAGCDRISNQGEERVADQLCIGLADAEIQEDLLKHPDQDMGVEDTIRFVEVRAAGKRSAALITTATSTSAIDDDEGGEAISSAYICQQKRPTLCPGPGPGKATPTQTRATPQPESTATPTQGTPQPGARANPSTEPPEPRPTTVASKATENRNAQPTGASTALHMAPRVHPAVDRTILPRCAGNPWNTKAPYSNKSTRWLKEPSTIRPGTQHPSSGPRGSYHPNRT